MGEKSKIEILSEIQSKVKATKDLYNTFGSYSYRSAESIVEALKPVLSEYGAALIMADDVVQIGEWIYTRAVASIYFPDGESVSSSGYAREAETKKGMDVAQISGAASSYARKYALGGLLALDDGHDADAMDNTGEKKKNPAKVVKKTVAVKDEIDL